MSKDNRYGIVTSVNILLILVMFYNFISWGEYGTRPSKLLGIFACIYMLNDWITTRSTYNIYSSRFFFQDIITIFLFAQFPTALKDISYECGYSPYFWLLIGLTESVYVIWASTISKKSPSEKAQKSMVIWTILSSVTASSSFALTYFLLIFKDLAYLGHFLSGCLVVYILIMTIKWNHDRFVRSKKEETPFIS